MCSKYRLESGATAGSVRLSDRDHNPLMAMIQLGPQQEEEPLAANHAASRPAHNSQTADIASAGSLGSAAGSPGTSTFSNDAILRHNELVDLNNSASADIINRNFQAAIGKLEQCHQADPNYATAESNLEIAYYNWAVQLYDRHDYSSAVDVLSKGLSCLHSQQHPEKKHLVEVLQIYAASLRQLGNDAEAQRAEARVDQISVGD
jgi:tetratricopeptide (TPR) repeat protein